MTAERSPAIQVRGLVVQFGGVRALDAVTVDIPVGGRHVLIGPNGAGKTTLFNAVAGLVTPTSGDVQVHGSDMRGLSPYQRARRGVSRTFQITTLMSTMSVQANVELALMAGSRTAWKLWPGRPARSGPGAVPAAAAAILQRWSFETLCHRTVAELPYGAQRQLEVILALAGGQRILLLDEPTAGLSTADRHHMIDLIEELDGTVTVVLVEHDMEVAMRLASDVTVLADGRVVGQGDKDSDGVRAALAEVYA